MALPGSLQFQETRRLVAFCQRALGALAPAGRAAAPPADRPAAAGGQRVVPPSSAPAMRRFGRPARALPSDLRRLSQPIADAAAVGLRLTVSALRHGALPTAPSGALILWREGPSDLHWKTLGDALVRFAQHSGPLLTKLGQILATRGDLLPDALCTRLEALYTRQPPMRPRQLEAVLRTAFAQGLPFSTLDRRPIAVGSIAQVHRAELPGRQRVVVKVVRPGLRREIERDLRAAQLFFDLVLGLPGFTRTTRRFVTHALHDLGGALRSEVDLRREAEALEEFGRRSRANPRVCVPRVYRQWCSENVLVMEELAGEPLSAVRARAKVDPDAARKVADLALKEILKQIFDDGRFHADPHAGNLLLLPDGRLGLIDLGLTGESGEQDRLRIARTVRAFVSGDSDTLSRTLLEFGTPPPDFQLEDFKLDVMAVVRQNEADIIAHVTGRSGGADAPEDPGRLERFVGDLFKVAHRHNLYVPPSSTLLIKTIVTIEGVARSLNPNINIVAAAVPIVLASLAPRWFRWRFWRA
jgi:ubiquinone biosynthesis protein